MSFGVAKVQGKVVQTVNTQSGTMTTGPNTALIPYDNTIPQNGEGTEFMTLAITPKNTANILRINVVFNFSISAIGIISAVALFQDSVAGALAVAGCHYSLANDLTQLTLAYSMTAGTTSETTFKVRAGGHNTSVLTFNGREAGALYGGTLLSSITITEYTP